MKCVHHHRIPPDSTSQPDDAVAVAQAGRKVRGSDGEQRVDQSRVHDEVFG